MLNLTQIAEQNNIGKFCRKVDKSGQYQISWMSKNNKLKQTHSILSTIKQDCKYQSIKQVICIHGKRGYEYPNGHTPEYVQSILRQLQF